MMSQITHDLQVASTNTRKGQKGQISFVNCLSKLHCLANLQQKLIIYIRSMIHLLDDNCLIILQKPHCFEFY